MSETNERNFRKYTELNETSRLRETERERERGRKEREGEGEITPAF